MSTKNNRTKGNDTKNQLSSQQAIDAITLPHTNKSQVSPLGSIAKFTSHAQTPNKNKRDEATIKRFKLQNVARRLLPAKRVCHCLRYLIPTKTTVNVYHDPTNGSAYYKNLKTCNSVWDCPVCSAKITEQKRIELMLGLARAYDDGYHPVLITYTLQHNKGDRLVNLAQALKDACSALKSGRWWQNFVKKYGWVGSILATEITNGIGRIIDNGWHPHRHELGILMPLSISTLYEMENELKAQWLHVLNRLGFDASWERGLTLKLGDKDIAEYVAKFGHEPKNTRWTLERELTKAPVKLAHEDGTTPFGLLELAEAGNVAAGKLFQEYSEVFHGSNQLAWSNGLRDLLGMGKEKSDEELNDDDESSAVLIAQLSASTWWKLLNLRSDARGDLLNIARTGDEEAFSEKVIELVGAVDTSPPHRKEEQMSVAHMCAKCLGDGVLAGTGRDSFTGRFYRVLECPHCKNFTRVFDVPETEKEVVDAALSAEKPHQFPAREAKVEEQLRLFPDEPTITY